MKEFYSYIKYYRPIVGRKFYLFIFMSLLCSLLEGIGIAMVIPILELGIGSEDKHSEFAELFIQFLEFANITPSLTNMLLLMVFTFVFRGATIFISKFISSAILISLQETIRFDLTKKLYKSTFQFINSLSVAHLNNVVTREIEVLVKNLKSILNLCSYLITLILFTSVAFMSNARVAMLSLFFALFISKVFGVFVKNERQLSQQLVEKNNNIQSYLFQILHYFKYLKATDASSHLISHMKAVMKERKKINYKMHAYLLFVNSSIEPLSIVVVSVFIYYEVVLLGSNLSSVIFPLLFLHRSLGKVGALQSGWHTFISTSGSLRAIRKLQDNLSNNIEKTSRVEAERLTTGISISNLLYKYEENGFCLGRISINLPSNTLIGIVGETGSGKTTFVDILCGLLKPEEGSIYWNEVPYNELNIRSRIGYVTQDPIIFNDTISNNITLWDNIQADSKKLDCLKKVIKDAKCNEFIDSLSQGLETIVGDGGVSISGGQRQRIALARELYRNPELLIVDEGTSAVDARTSSDLRLAFKEFSTHGTVILIAHQFSTIRDCELIVVFDKGKIAKTGSWEDMVNNNEWFAQSVGLQNLTS